MLEKKVQPHINRKEELRRQAIKVLKICQTVFGLTLVTGLRPCNMKSVVTLFTWSPNKTFPHNICII